MAVPVEVKEAIELFDKYVEGGETDKTILAAVITKLSEFAEENDKINFANLALIIEGKSGNRRLALEAVWSITDLKVQGDVYQKLMEIEKAALRAT